MGDALSFLVVDDEPLVLQALQMVLRKYGAFSGVGSVRAAKRKLDSDYDGIVVDVRLRDGSGLDVLEEARKQNHRAPAVVLSGALDHEVINRAAQLDARLVSKPCGTSELAPFLSDVLLRKTNDRVYAATERARHRWSLSEREVEILTHALNGKSRESFLDKVGIAANTYKSQVRRLLEKADYSNLSTLAIDLLAAT